jgi:hypothetical protein
MSAFTKTVLVLFACVAGYFLVIHGTRALNASLPKDMPRDADFVQTGYDVDHNEARGQWIACRQDDQEAIDFCRVTDPKGTVVYQGAFEPFDYPEPLPNNQLTIAAKTGNIWVKGPAELGPVPVIPLRNGKLLVPVQDREALADRWRTDPTELRQIAGM